MWWTYHLSSFTLFPKLRLYEWNICKTNLYPKSHLKQSWLILKNQRITVNNAMKTRCLHFKRLCCCYQLQCYHIVIPGRGVNISTHRGRVTHICVVNLTIIGSVNGLSPGRRQAIIWINAGILYIEPLGINFNGWKTIKIMRAYLRWIWSN